jgi:hypothetical protein
LGRKLNSLTIPVLTQGLKVWQRERHESYPATEETDLGKNVGAENGIPGRF